MSGICPLYRLFHDFLALACALEEEDAVEHLILDKKRKKEKTSATGTTTNMHVSKRCQSLIFAFLHGILNDIMAIT